MMVSQAERIMANPQAFSETNPFRDWRSVEDDTPVPGSFVDLSRNEKDVLDSVYWLGVGLNPKGLFWRVATPPNLLTGISASAPAEPRPPIDEDFWYVVLVEPQQEVTTVWRLHEQGRELYVPIIRRRVKTGRTGKNGQKVTRLIPKPMFPGYGFVRKGASKNINDILATRGVRELLRDKAKGDGADNLIVLPHEAVLAIFRKQSQKHQEFNQEGVSWRRRPRFKAGASVRVDAPGNVYDGYLADVEKDNGNGRIQVLLGKMAIRHSLPAEMIVAR